MKKLDDMAREEQLAAFLRWQITTGEERDAALIDLVELLREARDRVLIQGMDLELLARVDATLERFT